MDLVSSECRRRKVLVAQFHHGWWFSATGGNSATDC